MIGVEEPAEYGGGSEIHGDDSNIQGRRRESRALLLMDRLRSFGPAENRRDLRMTITSIVPRWGAAVLRPYGRRASIGAAGESTSLSGGRRLELSEEHGISAD